jgi:hypothetical protein
MQDGKRVSFTKPVLYNHTHHISFCSKLINLGFDRCDVCHSNPLESVQVVEPLKSVWILNNLEVMLMVMKFMRSSVKTAMIYLVFLSSNKNINQ